MTDELTNIKNFIRELAVLTERHGFVINGCGCCDSPYIMALDADEADGGYRVDEVTDPTEALNLTWMKRREGEESLQSEFHNYDFITTDPNVKDTDWDNPNGPGK